MGESDRVIHHSTTIIGSVICSLCDRLMVDIVRRHEPEFGPDWFTLVQTCPTCDMIEVP